MTNEEMTALVTSSLTDWQNQSVDKDDLPNLLQDLGMKYCGDFFALWELPPIDGRYRFEVRFGTDPNGPLIVEWIYRPVAA